MDVPLQTALRRATKAAVPAIVGIRAEASGSAAPLLKNVPRIGERALVIIFSDPRVHFFVVNAGGHLPFSPVQNPAWDFESVVEDYPLNELIGFDGRLVYTGLDGPEAVLARYEEWVNA